MCDTSAPSHCKALGWRRHKCPSSQPPVLQIQNVFELGDGSALFVTVARYRTPALVDIDQVSNASRLPHLLVFQWLRFPVLPVFPTLPPRMLCSSHALLTCRWASSRTCGATRSMRRRCRSSRAPPLRSCRQVGTCDKQPLAYASCPPLLAGQFCTIEPLRGPDVQAAVCRAAGLPMGLAMQLQTSKSLEDDACVLTAEHFLDNLTASKTK